MSDLTLLGDYQPNPDAVYYPSDVDGLVYAGVFGIDAARCARNFAPGMPDAVVVGAPTYGSNYVRLLPGTNWIQTMAEQTDSITIMAVARSTVDAYSYIASNNSGPTNSPPPSTTRGVTLRFETGTAADGKVSLAFNQSIRDGSNVDQEAAATRTIASTVNAWSVVSGRCDAATGIRTAKDWTSNLSATATSAFSIDRGVNRIIVGGAQTVTGLFTNAVDLAMVFIYNKAKTDGEQAAIYADWKAYFLQDGILI